MLENSSQIEVCESSDLCHRVKSFLQMQHVAALRNLEIEADNDTVVIYGNVSTFYERQVAIECCKRVAGVRNVVDHIFVCPRPTRSNAIRKLGTLARRPR